MVVGMPLKKRNHPNILITGTPGVGKSTLSKQVADRLGFEYLNVGDIAKSENCLESYDTTYECHIINEDMIVDVLEPKLKNGGKVVDYHGCDFFPERWFDGVFVICTNNTILYDRLKDRGYSEKKLSQNVECEIFQTILEEARDSYRPDIVMDLKNDTQEDLTRNVDTIIRWIKDWR